MKTAADAVVHKPFADGGCLSCHDPHGSNTKGMTVSDEKALCGKCHASLSKQAQGAKSVHAAFGEGKCTGCHNPHASKLKKLLLAPSPDLCFGCHKKTKEKLALGHAHPPADDCLTCHKPHTSAQPRLTVQPLFDLCTQCHDVEAKGFVEAHIGIAPKAMNCTSCHDPHGSKEAKLFKPTQHAPFAARQCDTCHQVSGKGK
jgi:predicted CXXCH cytochrome family protein